MQRSERPRADVAEARQELVEKFVRWTKGDAIEATFIPWLTLHTRIKTTSPECYVYEPNLALIVQGSKQVTVGDELFVYDESHFLLTSVDLPVTSCVVAASPDQPYMSLRVKLDLPKIRQMILDYEIQPPRVTPASRGMATGRVTVELLCAFSRLLDVMRTPEHLPVMADLIHREIVYHLLRSEQGGRLWQLAMTGSQSNRIQKVINWLKNHYAEPLRMEDLASLATMSVSSMHHHFREITSMSPLQFQKQLRLQEARRLMLIEDLDAGSAALRVGYDSPSQFSREYSRLFGQPPKRDIRLLRASTARP
ncbi:MAG TPA: AraC family transcriptional regulator [Stenomitos sp.]